MSGWTILIRQKLSNYLEQQKRSLQATNESPFREEQHFRGEIMHPKDNRYVVPVITCLRPLYWTEEEVSIEELSICMEMVSLMCEDIELCDDIYWRELYSLYGLWQGSTSSEIMGGVWIGASMMLSLDEDVIASYHAANLLLPLLFSTSTPLDREKWLQSLAHCLEKLERRGGAKSIFGHNWESSKKKSSGEEENTKKVVKDLAWFQSVFVPQVFPGSSADEPSICSAANSFIGFLSQQAETDSQAK